jgi:hypothetical protein
MVENLRGLLALGVLAVQEVVEQGRQLTVYPVLLEQPTQAVVVVEVVKIRLVVVMVALVAQVLLFSKSPIPTQQPSPGV